MEPLNLATLPKYLSDEASAWQLLERLRWPDGEPVCPHCGAKDAKHYFISARSGERRTKAGKVTYRRLWRCRDKNCRRQFSVMVGTIFESSHVPASKWLLAMWLMGAGKNSISALELKRALGVSTQTAWFMGHRLREAMQREPMFSLLSGTIVVDETFVGGAPKNRHQQGRPSRRPTGAGSKTGAAYDKTPVMALISKETGEACIRVIADVTGPTLRKALAEDVDLPNAILNTDGHKGYRRARSQAAGHEYVDHSSHEYVRGDVSTNMAESFFAQFKRSVDGTFHNISRQHLSCYADEFAFRWNTSKMTDAQRVQTLIDQTPGRRLTYRPVRDER